MNVITQTELNSLEEKLQTIDELSKAYQRIVSCSERSSCSSSKQEQELLDKISEIITTIRFTDCKSYNILPSDGCNNK
tara:strand:- start:169 stop:402 length:234 start_codon:yes stop_codon:yes gene_type:complete